MKNNSFFIIGLLGGWLGASSVLAQAWVPNGAPSLSWRRIAMSADGTKMAAVPSQGGIYITTNSGADWTKAIAPTNVWYSIASSTDGSRLVATLDNGSIFSNGVYYPYSSIYTSSDGGGTWSPSSSQIPGTLYSVASSADGQTLAAVGASRLFMSTNGGQDWTTNSTQLFSVGECVALSSDGMRVVIAVSAGLLYASPDQGSTWTIGDAPVSQWMSVACSADGTKLVAVSQNGPIYTSTNSGTNWSGRNVAVNNQPYGGGAWWCVASSADGTRLVAGASAGPICISSDSGTTWSRTVSDNGNCYSVAASADGSSMAAIDSHTICALQPGVPLSMIVGTNNLVFTWRDYTWGYDLQQNADLNAANWTNVNVTPGYADSHTRQVVLPPSAAKYYYRLHAVLPME